jgi:putative restriction endonuclease
MAYWWVSQNQSFRQERKGGFLWAPDRTEAGLTPFHWATMNDVRPGDVFFSYVGGKVVAVSVAKTAAYDSPRPGDLGEGLWQDAGKRVEVEYRDLTVPFPIVGVLTDLQPLLPERYSPLNRSGSGNQGYLFGLPPRAGRLLLDRIADGTIPDVVADGIGHAAKDTTERRALVLSRLGQGRFRDGLMGLWSGRCAVTGLDLPVLLRASHVKPWRDSDNRERLDPFNGLLLSPSYDAVFDAGLITFGRDGRMQLSADLTPRRAGQLGLTPTARIIGLREQHLVYLDHHRRDVFIG